MMLLGIGILVITIMVMDHECGDQEATKIVIKKNCTMF